jgi:phosphosulfolactate synthase (CoM biosynthesis protein A)
MIEISDKAHKEVKCFKGKAIMVLPYCEETEWNFEVLRISNGSTKYEVEVNLEEFKSRYLEDKMEDSKVEILPEVQTRIKRSDSDIKELRAKFIKLMEQKLSAEAEKTVVQIKESEKKMFIAMDCLEKSILANIELQKVNWTPQNNSTN